MNAQAVRIVDAVSAVWSVTPDSVVGRTRPKSVAEARKAAYWIARNGTDWSYPRIGAEFGRDHATVISGVQSIAAAMKDSAPTKLRVQTALELCREGLEMRHRDNFEDFHGRNPVVYATLARLARRAKDAGKNELGIACLWERMRWELFVETDTPGEGEPFKLNNNHRAFYAREIMQREPDLDGFFRLRESEADQ